MKASDPSTPKRRTVRLPGFDYRTAGAYFVTACSHNRTQVFNDERVRSVIQGAWDGLSEHFGHVRPDRFVVMPNHVHGVLFITNRRARHAIAPTALGRPGPVGEPGGVGILDEANGLDDTCKSSGPPADADLASPALTPLGVIVGSFKSAAARLINDLRGTRGAAVWQRGYYEHVIRDEEKLNLIRRYIEENPLRWNEDVYNPNRAFKSS